MTKTERPAVPISAFAALPGADYADAFAMAVPEEMTVSQIAKAFAEGGPRWISWLLFLRNLAVKPFGLKRTKKDMTEKNTAEPAAFLGIFPVRSESADRMVLGFDDRHLDFRIVIDRVAADDGAACAVVSTLIKRHNLLGRIYLFVVLPFHRIIVPAMLRKGLAAR